MVNFSRKTSTMKIVFTLILLVPAILFSQVGINTEKPTQTLEVNGRLKVGEDPNLINEEGAIRYNELEKDLEGFAEGDWKSLTSSNVGESAVYVQLYHFGLPNNGLWVAPSQTQSYNDNGIGTTVGNLPVPTGKVLVIDQVCATTEGAGQSLDFYAGIRESTNIGNGVNPQIYITGSSGAGTTCLQGNKAPLLVVSAGNSVQMVNSLLSDPGFEVRIFATGFLLNSLKDYYGL